MALLLVPASAGELSSAVENAEGRMASGLVITAPETPPADLEQLVHARCPWTTASCLVGLVALVQSSICAAP